MGLGGLQTARAYLKCIVPLASLEVRRFTVSSIAHTEAQAALLFFWRWMRAGPSAVICGMGGRGESRHETRRPGGIPRVKTTRAARGIPC